MPDAARLNKVLEHIRSLPEVKSLADWSGDGWYQREWLDTDEWLVITDRGVVTQAGMRCGTAACFAGWAVILFAPNGTVVDNCMVFKPDGEETYVSDYAQELLGLDCCQRNMLFAGNNDFSDLERIVKELRE